MNNRVDENEMAGDAVTTRSELFPMPSEAGMARLFQRQNVETIAACAPQEDADCRVVADQRTPREGS